MKLISEDNIRKALEEKLPKTENKVFYEISTERYGVIRLELNDHGYGVNYNVAVYYIKGETKVSWAISNGYKVKKKDLTYLNTYNGVTHDVYDNIDDLVKALWLKYNKQEVVTALQGCKDYDVVKQTSKLLIKLIIAENMKNKR